MGNATILPAPPSDKEGAINMVLCQTLDMCSSGKQINRQNELIQEIHAVAHELSESYTNKYLSPTFCNGIALIYNDKLMNYRKAELNDVAMTLGVIADTPGHKQQLCEVIVKHYTDRLNLIAAIQHSLNFCSNRIFALTTGPRCDGYPETFDQPTCSKRGGRWVEFLTVPDKKVEGNKLWFNYLDNLQDTYLKALSRLLEILEQLRDFDQDVNDETLKSLGKETEKIIDLMQNNCSRMYKLMLTTPTLTKEEQKLKQEAEAIDAQEAAARTAALRAANNLENVPPQ